MVWNHTLSVCVLLIGTTQTTLAEDVQSDADLRCMAVMAKINQLPDPRHQLEFSIGGYYYLGRLNAARPELDIAQATAGAFSKMSAAEFLSETTRCEREMQAQGKSISSIGSAMPKVPPTNNMSHQGDGLP